ncbi:hypothetical protein [Pelagibacterium halotolerans]|uniref:hypothetical protein n=1 Tax=Pelagibacterium halotolerans TaxID=531813 RepID=UPI00384B837F
MNKTEWGALPANIQDTLEQTVCDFALHHVAALAEADEAAVAEAEASGDVTVHNWPEEERAKVRAIAMREGESVAEQSQNA